MRTLTALLLTAALAALGPTRCLAAPIVVPNGLTATEGNSNNIYPFSTGGQRYQQVYSASEFPMGPFQITGLAFRPDSFSGSAFSSTLPDIQINLSTTLGAPDALNPVFAVNVGTDDTEVFARGSLALSSTFTGGPPRDFDIVIPFTTPFIYDPAAGNLLLDVRDFAGGSTTSFDAHFELLDSISRLYSSVSSLSGNSDTLGLVTRFEIAALAPAAEPVPEPASLAVWGLAALGLALGRARCQRRPTTAPA